MAAVTLTVEVRRPSNSAAAHLRDAVVVAVSPRCGLSHSNRLGRCLSDNSHSLGKCRRCVSSSSVCLDNRNLSRNNSVCLGSLNSRCASRDSLNGNFVSLQDRCGDRNVCSVRKDRSFSPDKCRSSKSFVSSDRSVRIE